MSVPDRHPALRRLACPRLVLIAPARAWAPPDHAVLQEPGTMLAGIRSFDTQRDRPAVLGYLDTWARLWWGPNQPCWFARVGIDVSTGDGLRRCFRLWLPADAITPLDRTAAAVRNPSRNSPHPAFRPSSGRAVLIDPWSAWARPAPMSMRRAVKLRVNAESFDLAAGPRWLPGRLDTWARLRWDTGRIVWFGRVALELHTRNRDFAYVFRIWVPQNALRPTASYAQS